MIARLAGELVESTYANCVIDAGGVGYDVQIALSTFEKLPPPGTGAKVTLLIQTQVREDAIVLFGFATREERDLFRLLLTVSGVGGKLALNVLSAMPVNNFCQAVAGGDLKLLGRVSGIGKRTAERLVVELKDKVGAIAPVAAAAAGTAAIRSSAMNDAALALESLGYKRDAVDKALVKVGETLGDEAATCEQILRCALQHLTF